MKYYSTKNKAHTVSLKEAVLKGLAPDGGLYMPESFPRLPEDQIASMVGMDFRDVSQRVAQALFGSDLDSPRIESMVNASLNFETPLVKLSDQLSSLELFHGPTLAFKDVGARFMARMLSELVAADTGTIHVLVATSGDTGSAVANGFLDVEGIHVHVLYPKNKVSKIQEIQFTTLGENISALEVDGSFDDCQRLVKQAFNDPVLKGKLVLTSANSINLARLLPQSFYYFNAWARSEDRDRLVFCVPSGNFGNLTAGLIARKMGLPVKHFITSTNVNDIVPKYLESGNYDPRPSVQTIANAMDVGDPSNFVRMLELYDHSAEKMREDISAYSYTDDEIREGIRQCNSSLHYLPDPHGATGYLASLNYLKENPDAHVAFLETAHPVKFRDTVEEVIQSEIEIPERLAQFFEREKQSLGLSKEYTDFQSYLLDQ